MGIVSLILSTSSWLAADAEATGHGGSGMRSRDGERNSGYWMWQVINNRMRREQNSWIERDTV